LKRSFKHHCYGFFVFPSQKVFDNLLGFAVGFFGRSFFRRVNFFGLELVFNFGLAIKKFRGFFVREDAFRLLLWFVFFQCGKQRFKVKSFFASAFFLEFLNLRDEQIRRWLCDQHCGGFIPACGFPAVDNLVFPFGVFNILQLGAAKV